MQPKKCICLNPAVLENTRKSITPKITLNEGEYLKFAYNSAQAVTLKIWNISPWAQKAGTVGPYDYRLFAGNQVGGFEFKDSKLFYDISKSSTKSFPVPTGETVVQIELAGWDKNVIRLSNVSLLNSAGTSMASEECFFNQSNESVADKAVACSACTSDNITGCFGGFSTVAEIVGVGIAAFIALFLLRRLL